MTREEILGKITAPERVDFDFTKDEVLTAMSEFAQQEAIAFAEWKDKNGWKVDYQAQETHSTEQLYQIFKTTQNG